MDRLFLDANVLFSAAYRAHTGLLDLWQLKNAQLCTSHYAVEEAKTNLDEEVQRRRLMELSRSCELFAGLELTMPAGISLPEKDRPILMGAMEARATHLLTGDLRHFGKFFGKRIAGILVLPPGEYLRRVAKE